LPAITSNVPPKPITKSTPSWFFQHSMNVSFFGDVIATNSDDISRSRAPRKNDGESGDRAVIAGSGVVAEAFR
jgi:hypothetical protein